MAKAAQRRASQLFVWIIMILLVVGLAGFGVTNFGGTIRTVGSVGDTEIDVNTYARALDQELRAVSAQAGENITLATARQFGLDTRVLQRLLANAAIENETNRLGLSVGDGEVQRQLLSAQNFRGVDGKFDQDAYEFALGQSGLSVREFEDSLRKDTAGQIIQRAVVAGVVAPGDYADVILSYIGERRSFSWIKLDETTVSVEVPEPSQDDLRAFYDQHTDLFMLPEVRKITYTWLSPDDIVDDIKVDENALRTLYEENAAQYNVPERRLVERLVFATPQDAQKALADIATGATTFEALVEARGLTLDDVDMGDVTKQDLGAAGDTVFALEGPGLAGPVDTDLGPAIFRVNGILAARNTPYEEARPELLQDYAADAARRQIEAQANDFEDLLAGGATLEDLAAETGMKLGQIDWHEGYQDGIAAYETFNAAARAITTEDFPTIAMLEDGGVFAVRLDEVVAAHPQPFEEAIDKVRDAWVKDQIAQAIAAEAESLMAKLSQGAPLSSLGYPTTVETKVTRDAFIEGTPPDFLPAVFGVDKGEAVQVTADDGVLIAQVSDILPPDPEDERAQAVRQAVTEETAQGIANDMLLAFTRDIENEAGISLNSAALNAVHAQFP